MNLRPPSNYKNAEKIIRLELTEVELAYIFHRINMDEETFCRHYEGHILEDNTIPKTYRKVIMYMLNSMELRNDYLKSLDNIQKCEASARELYNKITKIVTKHVRKDWIDD